MMAEILFEVDASQIVTKMHFAGLQNTRSGYSKGAFFVNTGIKNDDPNGKPEKIGKTKFDLESKDGLYQFGWVKPIEYKYGVDISDTDELIDEIKKLNQEINDEKIVGSDENAKKERESKRGIAYDKLAKICEKLGIEMSIEEENIDELEKRIKDAKEDETSSGKYGFKKEFQQAKKEAFKLLKDYMDIFAGADNSNVVEDSIGVIQVSNDIKGPNDKRLVKDFQIQRITPEERKGIANDAKSDPNNAKITFCFYVNYSLNVPK